MWKTILAVTLLLFSLATLAVVGQVVGFWDWAGPLWERMSAWPALAPHVERYELGRETGELLASREAHLAQWQAELEEEAAVLAAQWRELDEARWQLERREAELADWEVRLAARQAAVERLEEAAEARDRLRALYEAMRPQEAARILVDLDNEEISLLLAEMSPRQAGQILAALPPERAAEVSRRLGL